MMTSDHPIVSQIGNISDIEKLWRVDMLLSQPDRPDPEIDRLWAREAESRWEAYKEGKLETVSYDEVMERYE